jgi:dimethylargininase
MTASPSKRAIVRSVSASYEACIRPAAETAPIDMQLVLQQHEAYCAALAADGYELTHLPADDSYPDACYVEDPVLVVGDLAIVPGMQAATRRGEAEVLLGILESWKQITPLRAPATLDGGDVVQIGNDIFIGLTERTNAAAVEQVGELVRAQGKRVTGIPVQGILHLKSVCTRLSDSDLLVADGHFDLALVAGYELHHVPPGETYAANALALEHSVLIAAGYPGAKALIEALLPDKRVVALDTTEFKKGGGSLTCLSQLLD